LVRLLNPILRSPPEPAWPAPSQTFSRVYADKSRIGPPPTDGYPPGKRKREDCDIGRIILNRLACSRGRFDNYGSRSNCQEWGVGVENGIGKRYRYMRCKGTWSLSVNPADGVAMVSMRLGWNEVENRSSTDIPKQSQRISHAMASAMYWARLWYSTVQHPRRGRNSPLTSPAAWEPLLLCRPRAGGATTELAQTSFNNHPSGKKNNSPLRLR
jgi:hypothetical protein